MKISEKDAFDRFQQDANDTTFICFSSFEERCKSAANLLGAFPFKRKAILYLEEFFEYSNRNTESLHNSLNGAEISILKNSSPLLSTDILIEEIDKSTAENTKNILIDITCFNREVLLLLLNVLRSKENFFENINLLYNEASSIDDLLSFGAASVRSVLGYSGLISPLKRDHLVVILGYEIDRAKQIIESYEPDSVTIAVGKSDNSISEALYKKNQRMLEVFRKKFLDDGTIGCPLTVVEIPVNDSCSSFQALSKIADEHSDNNIIVAPLNTKLSTIGAAYLTFKRPEIQICYAQMPGYNFDSYSSPSDKFYLLDLKEELAGLS